ncbi:hypothetical protein HPB49_019043 [Dermacentor silvarum]|uniref:Uncharacterized protein n=1 Tax=Dermacentor silvarum TaxID=543639 RepID=A0ACB8CSR6_DERSI|nr:hypothetical protein HPB49_019043 [Dermacentor silvarum]
MWTLMDDSTNDLLGVIEDMRSKHKSLEFRELFQRLTAEVMIRSAFGLKSNLQKKDRRNSIAESLFQEGLKSFQEFRRAWINFLTEKQPVKMVNVTGKKRCLTNVEILANGFSLFMAGFSPENKCQLDPVVYQPFGQGPRNCVGMRFAQLEMRLAMAKLLAKYKLILDDRHIKEKHLEIESTFILAYPKNGIWLKAKKIS